MPKTIDILTVIDPMGFPDNEVGLSTPIDQIKMVDNDTLDKNVWMLAEHQSVVDKQGTWNLVIKASSGDVIRWWDTSVVQDTDEDMIIVGFKKSHNWDDVLESPLSDTKGCGIAYIKSGFKFDTLQDLKFAMNSFQNNYIYTKVKVSAQKGTTARYYLVVAKIDVSHVGDPKLKGLYRFDPGITIL